MPKPPTVDLHVHSSFSDGRLTPRELAERAKANNVRTLAITDHDTMAGSADKLAACREQGIECILGVEMSCEYRGREAHVVSLFADPDSPSVARIEELSGLRRNRMVDMLEKLDRLGIAINIEDLPVADKGVVGRPHLARALVDRGVVKSVNEAFARFLYDGGPVHVDKTRMSAAEGIALSRKMGGISIIAHPGLSGLLDHLDDLVALGLEGVEVYHPKHGGGVIANLLRYCRERGLLVSGGSDFHGPGDGPDIGAASVPPEVLEPMRELLAARA